MKELFCMTMLLLGPTCFGGSFIVHKLEANKISSEQIKKGIETTFSETGQLITADQEQTIFEKVQNLQQSYRSYFQKNIELEVKEKEVKKGKGVYQVSFPSLYQREKGHPSNQVHLDFYEAAERARNFNGIPYPTQPNRSKSKRPGVLVIHHSVDQVEFMKEFGSWLNKLANVNVAVLHLPHYGKRRLKDFDLDRGSMYEENNVEFFDLRNDHFEKNIFQSLIDIRTALDWLKQRPNVDANKVSSVGFSLGGILQLIYAGFDGDHVSHNHVAIVGGGDISKTLKNCVELYPHEALSKYYNQMGKNLEDNRLQWAYLDPFMYIHQAKEKNIVFLKATEEELLDKRLSVEKSEEILQEGKNYKLLIMNSPHNPSEIGVFKQATQLFIPVMRSVK